MKTLLYFLLFLIIATSRLTAGVMMRIDWAASSTPEGVTAYVVNEKMLDGTVRKVAEVDGKTTSITADFAPGTHTLFVVAKAGDIHSEPSAACTFTIPGKPGTPRASVPPIALPPKSGISAP